MSTTRPRSFPTAESIRRRARWQSFSVTPHGGGTWGVQRRGGDPHTVVLRGGEFECDCESFNYHCIHGPRDRCIHAEVIRQIADGQLCPTCTYPRCRPSCPRGDHR